MPHPAIPVVGANFARRTTVQEFGLLTPTIDNIGRNWLYVLASEAVATGTCTVNTSTGALTDAAGSHTADTAFASGEYGWVRETTAELL